MADSVSDNKKFKTIHIVFTIIDFIALVFFSLKMIMVSYANIYQYGRATGIENVPLYLAMIIVLLAFLVVSVGMLMLCIKWSKKLFILYAVFIIFIIAATIAGCKLSVVNEYTSSGYNKSQSEYLPIDKFAYDEDSEDYYFYRDVKICDVYWIGSSSYKNFAAENRTGYYADP